MRGADELTGLSGNVQNDFVGALGGAAGAEATLFVIGGSGVLRGRLLQQRRSCENDGAGFGSGGSLEIATGREFERGTGFIANILRFFLPAKVGDGGRDRFEFFSDPFVAAFAFFVLKRERSGESRGPLAPSLLLFGSEGFEARDLIDFAVGFDRAIYKFIFGGDVLRLAVTRFGAAREDAEVAD